MTSVSARGEIMKSKDGEALRSALRNRRRFDAPESLGHFVAPSSTAVPDSAPSPFDSFPQDSLQRISDRLREALRCDAVAIRLMGNNKELRYAASSGRTFAPDMMSGQDHSGRPYCVCDQVCESNFDDSLSCFTDMGSFVVNSLTDSVSLGRRASAPRFAHLLNGQAEFQSLVVAPIRAEGMALGVVQCAAARPHHFNHSLIQLIESVVNELSHDIYYDSLWQPRSFTPVAMDEYRCVACPICGRERDQNGVWRTDRDESQNHRTRHNTRQVVCPSCLRLCNFE
ncbi:MAG: GAF domain-containing protein [candidate division Zixibacteria bacterium]|nr:GAF domain-containing protein [candidate division Zixibacteria bacterium]